MITTGIHPSKLNMPTRDAELNALLKKVRQTTGQNWQAVEYCEKLTFGRRIHWYGLYLEVGGVLPYQQISGISTAKEAKGYLAGFLAGIEFSNKREGA